MPLYEYQCKKCGHRFERIQSFSAEDVKECPVCHGEVERLISTPARPHFKGSGFYSTDYGSKPAASSGESTPAPAAKTESTPAPAAAPSTPSKSE
jgi:putative FmdB family regulatory protein